MVQSTLASNPTKTEFIYASPISNAWTLNPQLNLGSGLGPGQTDANGQSSQPVQPYYLDTPQETPCTAAPRTCFYNKVGLYACSNGLKSVTDSDWAVAVSARVYYELFPGSPAVCGHGNREFSFLARRGTSETNLLVAFLAGGTCQDAQGCGADPALRTMAVDNDPGFEKAPAVFLGNLKQALLKADSDATLKRGIFDPVQSGNPFKDWNVIVIPDCTGDLHIGNNSCTYGKNTSECITAHHRGAVNTGLAISWVVKNFPSVTQILALGTGVLSTSKADGGHGAAFWTKYLQEKYPSAKVRTIIDSSMALFGPDWFKKMKDDPWGSIKSKVPDADSNSKTAGDYLLPKVEDWSITSDDMSAYYELISKTVPTVAFAEASSIDEPVQQMAFVGTGGKLEDCCLDGCSCDFRTDSAGRTLPYGVRQGIPPYGLRGGQLDWIKTLKVTVLRRMTRMENNYRAWLIKGLRQPSRFLFPNADWFSNFYPRPGMEITPTGNFLQNWAFRFANGAINFNDDGTISGSQLSISNV
eukprot:CAMPEP_0172170794 /NCGR_PEP_ID=MMETSP1050-20130122/11500_1 /TAXON_ID=233186 /ORGANISM="Cryptomonas curvata, Strain CCAP979/52" /LENGTH=526 /DNA_ID=CAMNT_0012842085 /DNA_START=119 /DNA_END=1699 /DNA_ORIENTATION=-